MQAQSQDQWLDENIACSLKHAIKNVKWHPNRFCCFDMTTQFNCNLWVFDMTQRDEWSLIRDRRKTIIINAAIFTLLIYLGSLISEKRTSLLFLFLFILACRGSISSARFLFGCIASGVSGTKTQKKNVNNLENKTLRQLEISYGTIWINGCHLQTLYQVLPARVWHSPTVNFAKTSGKFFSSHCRHFAGSGMYSQYCEQQWRCAHALNNCFTIQFSAH